MSFVLFLGLQFSAMWVCVLCWYCADLNLLISIFWASVLEIFAEISSYGTSQVNSLICYLSTWIFFQPGLYLHLLVFTHSSICHASQTFNEVLIIAGISSFSEKIHYQFSLRHSDFSKHRCYPNFCLFSYSSFFFLQFVFFWLDFCTCIQTPAITYLWETKTSLYFF